MDTGLKSGGEGKKKKKKVGMKKMVEVRSAGRSAHALRRTGLLEKGSVSSESQGRTAHSVPCQARPKGHATGTQAPRPRKSSPTDSAPFHKCN